MGHFEMRFSLHSSDETFDDYQGKVILLAALKNSHMFLELKDIPEVERKAKIAEIEDEMEQMSH
jgi:hypothetical protein